MYKYFLPVSVITYITKQNRKNAKIFLGCKLFDNLHIHVHSSFDIPDSEIPSLTHLVASGDPLGGKDVQFGKIRAK